MRRNERESRPAVRVVLAGLALLLAAGGASAATGGCFSADVPETLVLPDGSVRDAGRLTVCLDREFTPMSVLNRISIDGESAGVFLATVHESRPASRGDRSYLLFGRRQEGGLVLLAVGARRRDRLQRLDVQVRPRVMSHWDVAVAPSAATPPTVVLLAARGR